jgi:PhnB protein
MPQPIPYLSFNGNCKEAMRFYEKALLVDVETMLTFGETPMAEHCVPAELNQICHACLVFADGGMLYAGDCPGSMPYEGIKGVSITLNYPTIDEATRAFNALSDGGTVSMPMQPAFWAKIFGMVVDRFGTPWIVNGENIPV